MADRLSRFVTVRVSAVLAAVMVVAVALAVGAVALVTMLRWSLENSVQTTLELRARDIAGLVASGPMPASLAIPGEETSLAQVVDAGGAVVAASPNLDGEPPIATFPIGGAGPAARTLSSLPIGDGQRFRVVGLPATTASGPVTVYVAASLETTDDVITTVTRIVSVGAPLLLMVVGVTTWRLVGRSLRPVERIRERFEEISTRDLHRRVPVPPTRDEIGRLATTVNGALDRLETSVARQRRFVGDASHELRSPLTSMRAELEVSIAHPELVSWSDTADGLLAETGRLEDLVRDLLLLARFDLAPTTRRPVDVSRLTAEETARRAPPIGLTATSCLSRDAWVDGDVDAITRLLRNLHDNAARHARHQVRTTVAREGNEVVLAVDDDGAGIPVVLRDAVVEPFTRLDDARARDDGGSGLGLAIVKEIATSHGASLTIDTSDLGGARVSVRFPCSSDRERNRPDGPGSRGVSAPRPGRHTPPA